VELQVLQQKDLSHDGAAGARRSAPIARAIAGRGGAGNGYAAPAGPMWSHLGTRR